VRVTGVFISVIQCIVTGFSFAAAPNFEFRILRNGVVNDAIMDAIAPSGISVTPSGKWLLTFQDRGDTAGGCKAYFIASPNAGQTWSQPYQIIGPEKDTHAVSILFLSHTMDDGSLLVARHDFIHKDSTFKSAQQMLTTSKITMMTTRDEGRSFTPLQVLKSPDNAMVSCMSAVVKLKNGDLILSAYCFPTAGTDRQPGAVYGSGFFRSHDGGKTWGGLEEAFKEVPGAKALRFNESAFAVKDDGSIVGFARIDSRPVNNMWKIVSKDNGKTWTLPEETNIPGNAPDIKRLGNGLYLMICGLCMPGDRPTVFFISADGENYERAGSVYYSRPEYNGGRPWGAGSGGTQYVFPVGENRAYAVFYGGDMALKGEMNTYIDGCLIEAKPLPKPGIGLAEFTPGQSSTFPRPSMTVSLPGDLKLEMIYVAPGSFTETATSHKITVPDGYYLGKYEITQAQYQAVMKNNPSYLKKDNYPVDNVSWYDTLAFCEALTQMERQAGRLLNNERYRLPTEAEWEFAARGGSNSQNYECSGGPMAKIDEVAWKYGNSNYEPHEVGLKRANELGFCDMSGNVWEWTDDCYSDSPAYAGGGQYGREMAIRGGDWNSLAASCRVSSRSNVAPVRSMRCLGFRVLRTISP